MKNQLEILLGQYTNKGRKKINQDFHDVYIPKNHLLTTKGIGIAIADGISSSKVSGEASKLTVVNFLQDYFSTPESWSVQKSASTVVSSINSWLYGQNFKNLYHLEKDKGYVCTFSSMIIKSTTAHIFHVGDTRIYKINDNKLEQLTTDHRTWVSNEKSYLARAMGIDSKVTIDYETLPLELDDIFMFATDGVYEFVNNEFINKILKKYDNDLDMVAKLLIDKAYENGSDDNLTVQFVKIKTLPKKEFKEIYEHLDSKKIPNLLEVNHEFDGYKILRELNHSSRSHVYLGLDIVSNTKVAIKIPSIELKEDITHLETFILEEWIAKRINNPHVLKVFESNRKSNYLYLVTEYIEGTTLKQWMIDNPKPSIELVRDIIKQIVKGLYSFHKLEMIFQDLRPHNIMIDSHGIIKLIDFGAVSIKGIEEAQNYSEKFHIQGTAGYSAPEYFLYENPTYKSDQFSLGVIIYEMLSGKLPYGSQIARTSTKAQQKRLHYNSLYPQLPIWIDETIKKSLSIEPKKRYKELSEFIFDLEKPNKKYINKNKEPLIKRDPVLFWKWITFIQFLCIGYLFFRYNN